VSEGEDLAVGRVHSLDRFLEEESGLRPARGPAGGGRVADELVCQGLRRCLRVRTPVETHFPPRVSLLHAAMVPVEGEDLVQGGPVAIPGASQQQFAQGLFHAFTSIPGPGVPRKAGVRPE